MPEKLREEARAKEREVFGVDTAKDLAVAGDDLYVESGVAVEDADRSLTSVPPLLQFSACLSKAF